MTKPCPFCGGTDLSVILIHVDGENGVAVGCLGESCAAQGPFVATLSNDLRDAKAQEMAAYDRWNQRGGEWEAEYDGPPIRKVDNA